MPNINQHVRIERRKAVNPNLSFCAEKPKALRAWVEELQMTNLGKTASLLHTAIIEVHTLKTSAENRFQLLEILKEPVRNICEVLSKNYLNQTLILTQKAMNAAQLTQALQSELASAYERVIVDTKDSRTGLTRKPPQFTATAIYRCMAELLQVQLRCHLLYSSLPDHYWFKINTLYLYAEQLNCLSNSQPTPDFEHFSSLTPAELYKVSLLSEASKPEQFRQQEISQLAAVLPMWANKVELTPYSEDLAQSFIVDLRENKPPQYHQIPDAQNLHNYRVLDTTELVESLRSYVHAHASETNEDTAADPNFAVPSQFGPDLLNKLSNAWGLRGQRKLQRADTNMSVQACTGLTSIHYFASGSKDFSSSTTQDNVVQLDKRASTLDGGTSYSNGLTLEKDDVWDSIFDPKQQEQEDNLLRSSINKTKTFKLDAINASAGGYCLRWDPEITEKIQAGDLIGLQADGAKPWGLGVVRWIRQEQAGLFNIGVEFLSSMIRCCAIQPVSFTDAGAEPIRALLLPGSKKAGQPSTIITYQRPFQAGSKAQIILDTKTTQIRLKQSVSSSYAFNQFTYMVLAENKRSPDMQAPATDAKSTNIESLYKNL